MTGHSRDARSDLDLIDAANRGEEGALETLYERYRDWVAATAYRITRSQDDALDVVQDVFLYFFKKFPGFELTAQLKTFLYRAVRNTALEKLRKGRRTVPLSPDAPEPAAPPAGAPPGSLPEAVQRLDEGEREIVTLRFGEDMSLKEIASALDIPLGTVKSRLHKALARLGEIMGKT